MVRDNEIGVLRRYVNLRKTIRHTFVVLVSSVFISDVMCLFWLSWSWIMLLPISGAVAGIALFFIFPRLINRFQKERDYVCIIIAFVAYLLLMITFLPSVLYVYSCGNIDALNDIDGFTLYFTSCDILLPVLLSVFISYLYWIEIILLYRNSELYCNCLKFKNKNE